MKNELFIKPIFVKQTPVLSNIEPVGLLSNKSLNYSQGLAGLVYVMYLVGRELGIREELNMCAGDLAEVREAAREILVTEIQVSVVHVKTMT